MPGKPARGIVNAGRHTRIGFGTAFIIAEARMVAASTKGLAATAQGAEAGGTDSPPASGAASSSVRFTRAPL